METTTAHSLSLRERRRIATATEIGDAALALFEKQGVETTTVGDIARSAGISERTFFRYFASKEEAVLDFQQWFDAPTRAWLSAERTNRPVLEQLEHLCIGVLRQLDGPRSDDAARLRRVRALMKNEPSLRAVSVTLDDHRAGALATLITGKFGDQVSLVEAQLIAEIVGLGLRTTCATWSTRLANGETTTLEQSYELVRSTTRSLFDFPESHS